MQQVQLPITATIELMGADSYPHVRRVLGRRFTFTSSAAGATSSIRVELNPVMVEGSFEVQGRHRDGRSELTLSGGSLSGLIYGAQEITQRLTDSQELNLPLTGTPALGYRVVWTWDHSTTWDVVASGSQETGAFNPYMRQPEVFESDYCRLIDFLSDNRVAALVVYGLLRDGHGGVESARRICTYAKERGVRLLPGVAINAYGGFFFEGDHRFNLATWLRQHPELALDSTSMSGFSIDDYGYVPFPHGDYSMAAAPHAKANLEWNLEGIEWILETLEDADGLNIEFGDYAGNDLLDDMRRLFPPVLERARRLRPDGWLLGELGWDHIVEPETPALLEGLPQDCVYQYTYNRSYWNRLSKRLSRDVVKTLPTRSNVLRAQAGSQWNQQRNSLVASHYLDAASLSFNSGLEGFAIFAEASDYHPTNELNYLAYARASYDGPIEWEDFVRAEVSPRLGGTEAARLFVEISGELEGRAHDKAWLRKALDTARGTAHGLDSDADRRWLWLQERLSRYAFNLERAPQTNDRP